MSVGKEAWSHQWWPALSSDYQLSCRATDVAGNLDTASALITVHAELDRTMTFDEAAATVDETIVLELANPNLPDIGFGTFSIKTLTIRDDEVAPSTVIFMDGFETGDLSGWGSSSP